MKLLISWSLGALLAVVPACDPRQGGGDPSGGGTGGPFQGREMLAGQFVRTVKGDTPFFRYLPMADAKPDLWLPRHTSMKLIQPTPGFSKIELDTGEVGYVSSDQLEAMDQEPMTPPAGPSLPSGPTLPDRDPVPSVKPLPPPILDPTAVPLPQ